jgi:hypothetical protein
MYKLSLDPSTGDKWESIPTNIQSSIAALKQQNEQIKAWQGSLNGAIQASPIMSNGASVTPVNPFKGEGGVNAVPSNKRLTRFESATESKLSDSARNQKSNGITKAQWISTIRKAHPGYSASALSTIYDSAR